MVLPQGRYAWVNHRGLRVPRPNPTVRRQRRPDSRNQFRCRRGKCRLRQEVRLQFPFTLRYGPLGRLGLWGLRQRRRSVRKTDQLSHRWRGKSREGVSERGRRQAPGGGTEGSVGPGESPFLTSTFRSRLRLRYEAPESSLLTATERSSIALAVRGHGNPYASRPLPSSLPLP